MNVELEAGLNSQLASHIFNLVTRMTPPETLKEKRNKQAKDGSNFIEGLDSGHIAKKRNNVDDWESDSNSDHKEGKHGPIKDKKLTAMYPG